MHFINLVLSTEWFSLAENLNMHEINISLTSFSGDFSTSEHMSSIRHLYTRY